MWRTKTIPGQDPLKPRNSAKNTKLIGAVPKFDVDQRACARIVALPRDGNPSETPL